MGGLKRWSEKLTLTKSEDRNQVKIHFADEGDRLDLPLIPSYEWAPHELRDYVTRFRWGNDLVDLDKADFFKENVEDSSLRLKFCANNTVGNEQRI